MQKTPATKTATGAVGTYKIRLEAVRILSSELGLSLLQPGPEGSALDADDLGNGLVGQSLLPEPADLNGLRHQLVKTLIELIELGFVADDFFNGRCRVLQHVERGDLIAVVAAGRHIQRENVAGSVVLAVIAHSVTQPPFTSGAHAAVMILLPLPKVGPPNIKLFVLLRGYLKPRLGLFVIDALALICLVLEVVVS